MDVWVKSEEDWKWRSPETSAYSNEAELEGLLQDLLGRSPDVLPDFADGGEVVRQFPFPSGGKADLVGLGVNGNILIVECKLDKNKEVKKAIIGQVLWYAAEMSHVSSRQFEDIFKERMGAEHSGPDLFDDQSVRMV